MHIRLPPNVGETISASVSKLRSNSEIKKRASKASFAFGV